MSTPDHLLSKDYRELVIFEADLSYTFWQPKGETPFYPELPEHIDIKWRNLEETLEYSDQLDRSPELIRERYASGSQCMFAIDKNENKVITELWLTKGTEYIDWIFKKLVAPKGGVLIYNIWIHPDYRGKSVYQYTIVMACHQAAKLGHPIVSAGVEERDFFPFARMHAVLGTALLIPKHTIVFNRLKSGIKVYSYKPNTAKSIAYSKRLKDHYFTEKATELVT